jgi:hypothetical protein
MRLENWLYTIPLRLRSVIRRNRKDAELNEELRDHIDRQIEENLAHGMPAEEARLVVVRAFGNLVAIREQAHNTWSWSGLELLLRSVRNERTFFGLRSSTVCGRHCSDCFWGSLPAPGRLS